MSKKWFVFFLVLFFVNLSLANSPSVINKYEGTNKAQARTHKFSGASDEVLPAPDFVIGSNPMNFDNTELIGDTFVFGDSWYDIQHNSTCGRDIQVDDAGWIHVAWMNGLEPTFAQRHVWYQLMDNTGAIQFIPPANPTMGVQVDQVAKSGYTTLEVYPGNYGMPSFHQTQDVALNYHTALYYDYFPQSGVFGGSEPPWIYELGLDLEVIWPKVWISNSNKIHIVSNENPASGLAEDPSRQYYARATFNPTTLAVVWETRPQVEIGETQIIATNVAASPVSNRVAIAWLDWESTMPGLAAIQFDNDLYLVISEDGNTWNFANYINVTEFIPPDFNLLPDTVAAEKDTFRCYDDIDILFDYNDVLHVFFPTQRFLPVDTAAYQGYSILWHWDEVNQLYSVVAPGWTEFNNVDPGAWNVYTQRASSAIDTATGDIYCMYQRYMQPTGPSPFYPYPRMTVDEVNLDISATGFLNGEIWLTKSTDNGITWSQGINVTSTASPQGLPGECLSELTPSMAPQIYNGYCHIFYVMDEDAGAVVQSEGIATLNDIIYHRVAISDVPSTPIYFPYPMHIDSTGMPPAPQTTPVTISFPLNLTIPEDGYIEIPVSISEISTDYPLYGIGIYILWDETVLELDSPAVNLDGTLIPPFWSAYYDDATYADSGEYVIGYSGNIPMSGGPGTLMFIRFHVIGELFAYSDLEFYSAGLNPPIGDNLVNGSVFVMPDAVGDEPGLIPYKFAVKSISPNPFNPQTTIKYSLDKTGFVSLKVYNTEGKEVAVLVNNSQTTGEHSVTFDGTGLSSGIYFYKLSSNGKNLTGKMILMK